ncbi:MAG TPA: hypothetical protein VJT49_17725 [Amycolatopsis sp.]|uniref:hypothetical protein n=1 Tax=Amycolatopsis sp. TaxID=37632 RepID=UPI002B47DD6E|nr:hypothetical protein [Amycolatopsis sp.]HKS46911.1 hypothetical protein [Amycolatopsis sp.]
MPDRPNAPEPTATTPSHTIAATVIPVTAAISVVLGAPTGFPFSSSQTVTVAPAFEPLSAGTLPIHSEPSGNDQTAETHAVPPTVVPRAVSGGASTSKVAVASCRVAVYVATSARCRS